MSRLDQFVVKAETAAGVPLTETGERIWLVFTPASNAPLPATPVMHEYPWQAFMETAVVTSGGWKGKVLGAQTEGRLKLTLDLSRMKGSADIEASRAYWVNPVYPGGGLLTIGGYQRTFDTPNIIEIYSDDGSGATPSQLKWIGVQVPPSDRTFEVDASGTTKLEVEFVDAITWLLEHTLAADVSAYAILNAGATADGPYRSCRSSIYSNAGKTYSHAHGDHPANWLSGLDPRREFTFYPLYYVYTALGATVDLIAQIVLRKTAGIITVSGPAPGVSNTTPTAAWTFYQPNWTTANTHNAAASVADPAVLGRINLYGASAITVGGFFYAGANATRDQIGSWENMLAFLSDTTEGLIGKVLQAASSVSITNAPTLAIAFRAFRGVNGSALAFDPDDFLTTPKVGVGKETVRGAIATVPGGLSRDQPRMVHGRDDSDRMYTLPRSWHTLPTLWPDGERRYYTPGPLGGITSCDIFTPGVNCLTLFFKTNAGGLLSSAEYVRLHQHVEFDDGLLDWTGEEAAYALPAPNPIDNYLDDPETGDTDFGQRLVETYLKVQLEASTPNLAAAIIGAVYGEPTVADYEGDVELADVGADELGNRVDVATFPDGNALLAGVESYLGDLPGEPMVASGEFDWIGGRVKLRLEGA